MAGEITINASIRVNNGNLVYASPVQQFQADQSVAGGMSPGQLECTHAGQEINLTALDDPKWCEVRHIGDDDDVYIELCIRDPETGLMYPFAELSPGEQFPLPLSRHLGRQYGTGTGTGTTNQLWIRSVGGNAKVVFLGFER